MTVTAVTTLQTALNKANPNQLGDIFAAMKLGDMLTPLKRAFTGLASGTVFDLTAIDGTGEVVGAANANRRALLAGVALRVVTGGTGVGAYILGDTGATPLTTATGTAVGVATISDDGKTLTFPVALTAFTIIYVPRSAVVMTAAQPAYDGAP